MRQKVLFLMLSVSMLLMNGCGLSSDVELTKDTETDTVWETDSSDGSRADAADAADSEYLDAVNNDGAEIASNNQLTQELSIPGEDFTLLVTYDTGEYDIDSWLVTDNKDIGVKITTKGLPEGTECFIDHAHYEIFLKSLNEEINGIKQDEMDDTYHGVSQDGFLISDSAMYYNVFSIEGYSQYLIEGYNNCYYGRAYERRVSESTLRKYDAYAEKVSAVFDLNIRHAGEENYHTVSVRSAFLIPLSHWLSSYDSVNVTTDEGVYSIQAGRLTDNGDGTMTVFYGFSSFDCAVKVPLYSVEESDGTVEWYVELTETDLLDRALK